MHMLAEFDARELKTCMHAHEPGLIAIDVVYTYILRTHVTMALHSLQRSR